MRDGVVVFGTGVEDPPPVEGGLDDEDDELGVETIGAAGLADVGCETAVEPLVDELVDVAGCERGLLRMCDGPAIARSTGIAGIDLSL